MNKFALVVALVAVVLGGLAFARPATVERFVNVVDDAAGAFPGNEILNRVAFKSGVTEGGVFTLATTSNAYTMTDAEMRNAKVISISSVQSAAVLALTTPASSTWPSLDRNGTAQTWIIDNLHTAAATTTTITAGAGVDIDGDTANDDVLNGGVSGHLTCWRLPDGNIRCYVVEGVDAG
jgi:hypothetical protein